MWFMSMLDKFFLFAGEHFALVASFVVLVGLFLYTEALRGGEQVSPQEASNLVNHEEALIIDLRSGDAFRKGHIHGSENVSADKLDGEIARLEKQGDKPLILVCELGNQSGTVGRKLQSRGFKRVYRLRGGIDAWIGNHMPLVKG
jgi:rhodanese-related sulfurtransferase